MRNSDVAATVILVVISFTTMVLAVACELARAGLFQGLRDASTGLGVYGQMDSFLISMEIIFWMVFLISLVGVIVVYFIGSHAEEGETYAPPQEYLQP